MTEPQPTVPGPDGPIAPPQWSADGQWWWNGYEWVPIAGGRPPSGPGTPNGPQGPRGPWGGSPRPAGRPWYTTGAGVVALVVGALVLVGILGSLGGDTTDLPASETAFVTAVQRGQDVGTANDIRLVEAKQARNAALCKAVPSRVAHDWVGTLTKVDTVLGGDSGVVEVKVADGVTIGTWNNGLSDLGDHTLLAPGSPLYRKLARLDPGDSVRFSGRFLPDSDECLRESSLTDTGSMQTPSFIFRFSALSAQ